MKTIYVKDFGARCDGISDDTAWVQAGFDGNYSAMQIQAALDAVSSPEDIVSFEPGKIYHIRKPLLLKACTLQGNGATLKAITHFKGFQGNTENIVFTRREGVNQDDVLIMNFILDGNGMVDAGYSVEI